MKFYILFINIYIFINKGAHSTSGQESVDDVLLCRKCGQEIVLPSGLVGIQPSNQTLRRFNRTILGNPKTMVQVLKNPLGVKYELITTSEANVDGGKEWHSEFSWFTGYSWKVAACSQCSRHIGWLFHRDMADKGNTPKFFVGLILDRLIHQSYADSLISFPKEF